MSIESGIRYIHEYTVTINRTIYWFYNSDYMGTYFESNFGLLQASQLHNNKLKLQVSFYGF